MGEPYYRIDIDALPHDIVSPITFLVNSETPERALAVSLRLFKDKYPSHYYWNKITITMENVDIIGEEEETEVGV